jgi:hypothetical protein
MRKVVRLKPRPFYPEETTSGTHFSWTGAFEGKIKLLFLPGIEP